MATNKPVFYRAVSTIIDRADQLGVPTGQFIDGCNRGVANGAIGINTGDYNPKESDFSRGDPRYASPASYVGHLAEAVTNNEDQMWGLTDADDQSAELAGIVGFDYATADTAADAEYGSSLVLTNYTGKTIPEDGWAWGFEAAGGDPVAPIVDAGGPYAGFNNILLAGSLTAGTDPDPAISWSVIGPAGTVATFTNGDTTTPTFVWTALTNSAITVAITVTPNDGPPVTDTAIINISG